MTTQMQRVESVVGHPRPHAEADNALLATLARQNADLDDLAAALAETEDRLLALYELTRAGANRLDTGHVMAALVQNSRRLVRARSAFVVCAPGSGAERCPAPVVQEPAGLLPDEPLVALLARLQAHVDEGGHDLLLDAADLGVGWPVGVKQVFVVPLHDDRNGRLSACLGLWLDRPATALAPDLKLARFIAQQGGAQLEIAVLHHERLGQARVQTELALARDVQMQLLPRQAPSLAGLELYAAALPALEVGGDFYGWQQRPGDPAHLFFYVGDVSGKGMAAALLMTMIRTILREAIGGERTMPSPAAVVARANAALYDDLTDVGRMATMLVGRYDAHRRALTLANAGHAPVLYRPADGPARLLEADGPGLGVLPQSLSDDLVLPLGSGDLLVVLSDGFSEAADERGDFFGIERLATLLDEVATEPAHEIGRRFFEAVSHFAANRAQSDDQTLLVVKGV